MKAILKKSSNNWGDEVPTDHLLSPNEASSTGLHSIRLLARGSHGNPPNTQALTKTIVCSPQTDSKLLFLKTALIQLIDMDRSRR